MNTAHFGSSCGTEPEATRLAVASCSACTFALHVRLFMKWYLRCGVIFIKDNHITGNWYGSS